MPRVIGVDIPPNKSIGISLTYLYGIGRHNALQVLRAASIDPQKRAKTLTDEEVSKLTQIIQAGYKVEGDLRRDMSANIKRLIDIGAYRGLRHKRGLPARGQRTRTNARTRKGPRPRVGVRKKGKPAAAPGAPARAAA